MAGVKITQLRSQMATGRRYGSFVGKPAAGPAADDVVPLWQLINGFTYQTYGLRV